MNSAFVGIVIYIIYNFITTIQSDISNRAEEALRQEQQKINNCERDYRANNCNVLPVPPLLILPCQILSDCMNTPPPRIERYGVHPIFFCWLRRRQFSGACFADTWFPPYEIGRLWQHRHLRSFSIRSFILSPTRPW